MVDMTTTGTFNQNKPLEKGSASHQNEHLEVRPQAADEESNTDLEKHASRPAGYDLPHIQTDDVEYVVTAKTWAVVVVRQPFPLRSPCS